MENRENAELITGGTSFIGVYVANHRAAKGWWMNIVILSRGRFKVNPAWL